MQCTIIGSLFQTMQSMQHAEKEPRTYGTGQPLHRAELSLLETIARHPDAKATALSHLLGVTRGALTQMGSRLMEKGLVERFSRPDNKKEKFYRLTGAGADALAAHEAFHAEANRRMCAFLRGLTEAEKRVILEFLDKVDDALPITRFDCHHPGAETPCI